MLILPHVIISTDGSGTTNGPGGWAAVLRSGDSYKEISGACADATNNSMELTAVIMALRFLKRPCEVNLFTDSEYVQMGITDRVPRWVSNGWLTMDGAPVKNRELWVDLVAAERPHRVTYSLIKGHAGHGDNERCDELAGMERASLLEPKSESTGNKNPKRVRVFNFRGVTDETLKDAWDKLNPEQKEMLRKVSGKQV